MISLFKTFRFRVMLTLILSMLFAGAMNDFLIYRYTLQAQFDDIRGKLTIIAQTAALMVDAETLAKVPLTPAGTKDPHFKAVARTLRRIKDVNPPIKYIYTMTKTEQPGIWQFVVDIDEQSPQGPHLRRTNHPGDRYNAGRFPELMRAFEGPTADRKLEIDEWGVTLSGYAPVRDASGRTVAVLGVDILADDVYRTQRAVHARALFVLAAGIALFSVIGFFLARTITDPVRRLVEGTRHVANGYLDHRIPAKGDDEIAELARSFNQMTAGLRESRAKLLGYFYRVVQSLIRILEAKDPYTRGHSERVSDYAERTAIALGLSVEQAQLIREAALLHDIGKLGIHETVLNKKGQLTDEEWEMIRRHPIVGEDILKPILVPEEMLAIIRGHHERFDGKGYPDRASSGNIPLYTAIVSVADAYDAMTYARAYRPALGRAEAVAELRKNSGTQFDPKVVEAFVRVVEE